MDDGDVVYPRISLLKYCTVVLAEKLYVLVALFPYKCCEWNENSMPIRQKAPLFLLISPAER